MSSACTGMGWLIVITSLVVSGCVATNKNSATPALPGATPATPEAPAAEFEPAIAPQQSEAQNPAQPSVAATRLRTFSKPTKSGALEHPDLTEVSGMVSSSATPGVLFAINDSGNSATLYAFSDDGQHQAMWKTSARNRDWEDMAKVSYHGKPYLIIGDTGDNRQTRKQSTLHLFEEPLLNTPLQDTLSPAHSIAFTFEDGPRNVEAFAVTDNTVYLISKEPVKAARAQASRLYTLPLPELPVTGKQIATYAGNLPLTRPNLEARLAASLASVDLNHPTALDFDAAGNNAYVLTYRSVVRFTRTAGQSWPEAFAQKGTRIHSHDLKQAEALAVDTGRAVFFTSERLNAPLWALPISFPL